MLRTESFKGTPTFDERKKLFLGMYTWLLDRVSMFGLFTPNIIYLDRITDASKYVKEGELDEERARNISEVRVYCDNEPETRFKLVADDKILYKDLPPDTPVNSLRDANMQEWEDIINKVRHKGTPGCWRPPVNGFVTLAHSSNLVAESDPYQNEYRLVVTVRTCLARFVRSFYLDPTFVANAFIDSFVTTGLIMFNASTPGKS